TGHRQVSGLGAFRSHIDRVPDPRTFPNPHHRIQWQSRGAFPLPSRGGSGFSPDSLLHGPQDVVVAYRSRHTIEVNNIVVNVRTLPTCPDCYHEDMDFDPTAYPYHPTNSMNLVRIITDDEREYAARSLHITWRTGQCA